MVAVLAVLAAVDVARRQQAAPMHMWLAQLARRQRRRLQQQQLLL
jgi:hypothetical protein